MHLTSTPPRTMPVVTVRKSMLKLPVDGWAKLDSVRHRTYAVAAVQPVAAPLACVRLVLTGTQPDLEALFAERYALATAA